jgi:hypothetical protein
LTTIGHCSSVSAATKRATRSGWVGTGYDDYVPVADRVVDGYKKGTQR